MGLFTDHAHYNINQTSTVLRRKKIMAVEDGIVSPHGGHIGVPKQWNGGRVGVGPVGVELFSQCNAFFCFNKFA